MKKRKSEISYMNILLFMGVIMIHVLSESVQQLPRDSAVYYLAFAFWRILLCAVPGFIFLSGLKLSLKPITDWKRFYLRRFTAVVIPYLIWMPIYYYFSCKLHYYSEIGVRDFFIKLIDGTSTAHFYFIIVIIQFYLLMPLWQLLTRRVHPIILLVLSAVLTGWSQAWIPVIVENNGLKLPLTNDRMITNYMLPWIAGCLCGASYDRVRAALMKVRFGVYAVCIVLAAADICFVNYINRTGLIYLQMYYVNMAYCITAIFALLAVFIRLTEHHEPGRFLMRLDKSSYYVYLVHLLVLMLAKYALDIYFPSMGVLRRFAVFIPVVYVIPIAACMLYTWIKERALIKK